MIEPRPSHGGANEFRHHYRKRALALALNATADGVAATAEDQVHRRLKYLQRGALFLVDKNR